MATTWKKQDGGDRSPNDKTLQSFTQELLRELVFTGKVEQIKGQSGEKGGKPPSVFTIVQP